MGQQAKRAAQRRLATLFRAAVVAALAARRSVALAARQGLVADIQFQLCSRPSHISVYFVVFVACGVTLL